jgi:hypothetical protein
MDNGIDQILIFRQRLGPFAGGVLYPAYIHTHMSLTQQNVVVYFTNRTEGNTS